MAKIKPKQVEEQLYDLEPKLEQFEYISYINQKTNNSVLEFTLDLSQPEQEEFIEIDVDSLAEEVQADDSLYQMKFEELLIQFIFEEWSLD